jgi:pimeloyl-ACP methyl ester carboxylesterase
MSLRNLINAVVINAVVLCVSLGCASRAQDIAGNWQGTLKTSGQEFPIVLQIAPEGAGWKADVYAIGLSTDPVRASSFSLNAGILKFNAAQVTYEGKLGPDGNSIVGTTLTPGGPPLEFKRATPETAWTIDPSKHSVQFITVDKDAGNDVKLEVLNWGGSGPPIVFLAGLTATPHYFDKFAPKFSDRYHVYGITRRGFGKSSVPAGGYGAGRLGDDILAVIDALKLNKPVLVGASQAGEELSSVGSRHPEKVSGLIYLDAGYGYAFYDSATSPRVSSVDLADVHAKLERLMMEPADPNSLIKQLLESDLPQLTKTLEQKQKDFAGMTAGQLAALSAAASNRPPPAWAIVFGQQKYNEIPVPILAIFAVPHDLGPQGGPNPAARAAAEARDEEMTGAQATAFEKGVPTAHVVRIPHAKHDLLNSNEAEVLREMNAFLSTLKRD